MQRMYAVAFALFAGISVMSCTAQSGGVPAVENIRMAEGGHAAFVNVVNRSAKDITAFSLTIDVTFQGGRQSHFEQAIDLLPLLISKQSLSGAATLGEGALRPNASHEVTVSFSKDEVAQGINAKLDAAVYLDLTAYVDGNQEALSRILALRKDSALAAQQIADAINFAAADSVSPDPRGVAIAQLKKLLGEVKSDGRGLELQAAIADLQNQARRAGPNPQAEMRDYANKKSKHADIMSLHGGIKGAN